MFQTKRTSSSCELQQNVAGARGARRLGPVLAGALALGAAVASAGCGGSKQGGTSMAAGAGQVSATRSTASASTAALKADGTNAGTISVLLHDATGAPVKGAMLTVAATGSGNQVQVSGPSDAMGALTVTATSTVPETKTYTLTAKLGSGASVQLVGTITLTFEPLFAIPSQWKTVDGPMGSPTTINGINKDGMVVGFTTNNGVNSNFVYDGATFTSVDVGDPAAGMLNAINASGTLVGVANGLGFSISGGKKSVLQPNGSTTSIAFGINDAGLIVGNDGSGGASTPGFLDAAGTLSAIVPAVPGQTVGVVNAQGIDGQGLAIGFYDTVAAPGKQHGFLYDTTTGATTLLPDPQTPQIASNGLELTQFLAINDNHEAVGYYQTTNGSQFGFVFNLVTMAYTYLDHPMAAPVKGVQITQITGVNASGEVCGFYIDAAGVQHGFTAK